MLTMTMKEGSVWVLGYYEIRMSLTRRGYHSDPPDLFVSSVFYVYAAVAMRILLGTVNPL